MTFSLFIYIVASGLILIGACDNKDTRRAVLMVVGLVLALAAILSSVAKDLI